MNNSSEQKKFYLTLFLRFISICGLCIVIFGVANLTSKNENPVAEKEVTSEDLYNSKYFKENQVDTSTLKSPADVFVLHEEEYLIYFYKDDCSYCELTAPIIYNYINEKSSNLPKLYFVDMSGEEMKGFWASAGEEENPNPTPSDFHVIGTPNMLYIQQDKAQSYLGDVEIKDALDTIRVEKGKE